MEKDIVKQLQNSLDKGNNKMTSQIRFDLYVGDEFKGDIIHKNNKYKIKGRVQSVHVNIDLKLLYIVYIEEFLSPLNGFISPSRAVFDSKGNFVTFDLREVF